MRRNDLSRRHFLQGLLVGAGGLGAFGLGPLTKLAKAAPGDGGKNFIFCYFSGGWDVLVGIDPRDPRQFTNGNLRDTRIQPAYDLLTLMPNADIIRAQNGLTFGPYIGDIASHADKVALVRGMSMDTLTHEVGRRRFLTGKVPSGLSARGSSATTWLAAQLGQSLPIPNLSVQVESYNRDQPNYATALKVNSVPDLLRALRRGDPTLDPMLDRQINALLEDEAACEAAIQSPVWQRAQGSREKSRQMVDGNLATMFDFLAQTPQMEQLRSHYRFTSTQAAVLSTPEAQAALAARAVMGGISRCVSIQLTGGLDTHFDDWARDQGPRQMRGWNALARIIEDLDATQFKDTGDSWLKHTVIVAFSEFSRTPVLNDRMGRDHHLTNSCLLAGGGIKGGTVVGASSDYAMAPQKADLATGAVIERLANGDQADRGAIILPEHILQTLFSWAGMTQDGADPADLRVDPISAILG